MTLYLSFNIETKQENVVTCQWSNTDIPVLAVSTDKQKITFFQDEAINISEHDMLKDGIISALGWHPSDMILAYGFQDGRVGVWVDEENSSFEEKNVHDNKIAILKFNNTGNRLVSCDSRGKICVWRFDNKLHKLCIYKQTYQVEEIIFPCFKYDSSETTKVPPAEKLNTLFFFCNSGGYLYLADDANSSPEICRVGGKIKNLLFYEKENSIILVTSNLLLVICKIHFNEQLTPKKVKLSIAGNPDNIKTVWAGQGLLAFVSGDDLVRFYYLETDQSYFLTLSDHELGKNYVEDNFSCIDYNSRKRILVVGSTQGKVHMWKCNATSSIIPNTADCWEAFCVVDSIPGLVSIKWSTYMGLLYLQSNKKQNAMLSETILQKKMNNVMKVIQTSQKTLEIIIEKDGKIDKTCVKRIDMNETIKGMDIFNNMILTWNGSLVHLYEVNVISLNVSKQNSFSLKSGMITLNEDSIIAANERGKSIDIYSFEGEKKNKIRIDSVYGEISNFSSNNKNLLITTSNNYLGIFDITRRSLKQSLLFRKFEKNGANLGEIRETSINCKGTNIAILCDSMPSSDTRIPDTNFFIYDVELDTFTDHEIGPNKIPIEVIWDFSDPRLFGVMTEYAKESAEENAKDEITFTEKSKKEWLGCEFFIFFYTSEYGIRVQETHKINKDIQGVFSLAIPSFYFIISSTKEKKLHSLLEKKFQFFQGLDNIDETIKTSLIEFSIFMSSNKLDEAYKIVKNIKNPLIWENMAQICIQTKRLDVLEICLSNMRFSRGIKALRESKHEKEVETKLALVAMHLGMIDNAKELLQEVGRYDILVKFFISIGDFDNAIDFASKYDRINLKNTYYRIAQNYEKLEDIEKAMKYYKLSGCHQREIPRMLKQKNKLEDLEKMIEKEEDPEYTSWWASYLESKGEYDKALIYYKKVKDHTNIVRVLVSQNKISEAKKICDDTQDTSACYILGKVYETLGDIRSAIYYYGMSQRINQAFRLCKENSMDNELYNMGHTAPPSTQNLIAEYFERKGIYEKASNLYMISGNVKKALNICLITQQYDLIREISESLDNKNDPELLNSLASYFMDQKEYDKALGIFIKIKEYDKALNICETHNLHISHETADSIFNEFENDTDETKLILLKKLAKQLTTQGDFELAHQKYVQMKDLSRAMKCLIKLGNKERVIEFAKGARNNELNILAANFLQSLDFHEQGNEEVMKNIVHFYSKAKAYLSLTNFYEMVASVEINEFRDYEKAIENYQAALSSADKIPEEDKKFDKKETLTKNIKVSKLFIHASNIKFNDHEEALNICNLLLDTAGIDDIVREGDIYYVMIEIYMKKKEYTGAYSCLELMKLKKKVLTNYIDQDLINQILQSVGKKDIGGSKRLYDNNIKEDF